MLYNVLNGLGLLDALYKKSIKYSPSPATSSTTHRITKQSEDSPQPWPPPRSDPRDERRDSPLAAGKFLILNLTPIRTVASLRSSFKLQLRQQTSLHNYSLYRSQGKDMDSLTNHLTHTALQHCRTPICGAHLSTTMSRGPNSCQGHS